VADNALEQRFVLLQERYLSLQFPNTSDKSLDILDVVLLHAAQRLDRL